MERSDGGRSGALPALALVAAAAVGCATSPGPAPEAALEVVSREPTEERAPEARVTTEPGNIVVEAALTAPDPCRDLGALVDTVGASLELRVVSQREADAGMCAQVLTRYRYRASIMNLEPGRYRLRVLHLYADSGWPTDTVVAERAVSVP